MTVTWIITPIATVWPSSTASGGVNLDLVSEPAGMPFARKGCGYDWSVDDKAELLALSGAVELSEKPNDWRDTVIQHTILTTAADLINAGTISFVGGIAIVDFEGSLPAGLAELVVKPTITGYQTPSSLQAMLQLSWVLGGVTHKILGLIGCEPIAPRCVRDEAATLTTRLGLIDFR